MSKFNPKKVPDWCKWIAVDKNGECWAYSIKPEINKQEEPYKWWPQQHGLWMPLYEGKTPKNWKNELYTWGY